MNIGVGLDSIEIHRFAHWHTYSKKKLCRIFSQHELDYCLRTQYKSAERFAVRFAIREAFLKALSIAHPNKTFALLSICRLIQVLPASNGSPHLHIDWSTFFKIYAIPPIDMQASVSLTHTKIIATALVFLTPKSN
jgi:phosphopantetheine--protein transferase-like protein